MRPTYDSDTATFRQTIRDFLNANLPADWEGIGALGANEAHHFANDVWRPVLAEHGYLAPAWPVEFGGGGLSELEQVILVEEFSKVGAPRGGSNDQFGITYCGNTILNWGTDEQQAEFLPKIISGEYVFCQGYSAPNAGSDLASLTCRSEPDGDEWVINGQKVWTSSAHHANWVFVLCRTDSASRVPIATSSSCDSSGCGRSPAGSEVPSPIRARACSGCSGASTTAGSPNSRSTSSVPR